MLTIVATATLDARTFFIIQSRKVKRHTISDQDPKLLQNCVSRTSAAKNQNLTIPLKSTVISTALFIICNVMIVAANVSTINSFYVVINSAIVVNSLRVPMIISFAFKENKSTVCRSRVQRQEWEQQNALQEKQKRIQAAAAFADTTHANADPEAVVIVESAQEQAGQEVVQAVQEDEPLTQITGAVVSSINEEPEVRAVGQVTAGVRFEQNLIIAEETTDNTVILNKQRSPPTSYSNPKPSRSFQDISNIEKIIDPLDYNHFSSSYSTLDLADDSRKIDSDYVPNYSAKATSDSDISLVETYHGGSTCKDLYGHKKPSKEQANESVKRWVSAGARRRPTPRGASVRARTKIRDSLVSLQDCADSSYSGIGPRRDTPQVSPSIPLNPATPMAAVAIVAPTRDASFGAAGTSALPSFVPTNDLILTRPAQEQNQNDAEQNRN